MKNERRKRKAGRLSWVIIALFSLTFVYLSSQINSLMIEQTKVIQDLSGIEYLNAGTQRLSRMIITGDNDKRTIFYLESQTLKSLAMEAEESLSFYENERVKEAASLGLQNWYALHKLFVEIVESDESQSGLNVNYITLASDNYFNSITNLVILLGDESTELHSTIQRFRLYSHLILTTILFLIVNNILVAYMQTKLNTALLAIATIDDTTGLFNRSKCQEILKDTEAPNKKQKAFVVVIDLNDLKKTNDIQGHRVGDELISTFARMLKEAALIFTGDVFLGRYGGDEFIVYHKNVKSEYEISSFIKELAFSANDFNKKDEKTFRVSYALGYAMNDGEGEYLTTRQLFDLADEKMYENKIEIKKARAEEEAKNASAEESNNANVTMEVKQNG